MQERSHAFAMKSQIWLLDPRPEPGVDRQGGRGRLRAVGSLQHAGDAGSAHPRLPRARPLHRQGQQAAAVHAAAGAGESGARHQPHRAAAGLLSCTRRRRSSSAGRPRSNSSRSASSTSSSPAISTDVGIILQGGMYNGVMRALERLGLADVWGKTRVPLYVHERHLSADRRRDRRRSAPASTRC